MKIVIESYGKKYQVETDHDDVSIEDYLDIFARLLHQVGFHSNTVKESIIEMAEELKE
jgi:hypothetical protein